jgi:hypothetical protein
VGALAKRIALASVCPNSRVATLTLRLRVSRDFVRARGTQSWPVRHLMGRSSFHEIALARTDLARHHHSVRVSFMRRTLLSRFVRTHRLDYSARARISSEASNARA